MISSYVEFKPTGKNLNELIQDAINQYEKMHSTKVDRLTQTKLVLPPAVTDKGEEIDLNELLNKKKAKIILVQGGIILGMLYVQNKNGKNMYFWHTFTKPVVLARPVDTDEPVFILPQGVKLDERGLYEE